MNGHSKSFENKRLAQHGQESDCDKREHETPSPLQVTPTVTAVLPNTATHAINLQRLSNPNFKRAAGQLQRAYGNHYLGQIAQQTSHVQKSPVVQAKLSVAAPHDRYEQNADNVANQVIRQIERGKLQTSPIDTSPENCKAAPEETPEALLRKDIVTDTNKVGQAMPAGMELAIRQARGAGQKLPKDTFTEMQGAIDGDLRGVQIHADARADALSRGLRSRAFTSGKDIFFRQGEFAPETAAGKLLLAHELVHVVQQSGDPEGTVQRKVEDGGSITEDDPDWHFCKKSELAKRRIDSETSYTREEIINEFYRVNLPALNTVTISALKAVEAFTDNEALEALSKEPTQKQAKKINTNGRLPIAPVGTMLQVMKVANDTYDIPKKLGIEEDDIPKKQGIAEGVSAVADVFAHAMSLLDSGKSAPETVASKSLKFSHAAFGAKSVSLLATIYDIFEKNREKKQIPNEEVGKVFRDALGLSIDLALLVLPQGRLASIVFKAAAVTGVVNGSLGVFPIVHASVDNALGQGIKTTAAYALPFFIGVLMEELGRVVNETQRLYKYISDTLPKPTSTEALRDLFSNNPAAIRFYELFVMNSEKEWDDRDIYPILKLLLPRGPRVEKPPFDESNYNWKKPDPRDRPDPRKDPDKEKTGDPSKKWWDKGQTAGQGQQRPVDPHPKTQTWKPLPNIRLPRLR